jgi:hypothetical protein
MGDTYLYRELIEYDIMTNRTNFKDTVVSGLIDAAQTTSQFRNFTTQ